MPFRLSLLAAMAPSWASSGLATLLLFAGPAGDSHLAGTAASGAAQAGTVSVTDFGARGNGIADDTRAIQRAFDSGRSIHLPAGRYLVRSVVLRTSGVRLSGEGTLVKMGGVDGQLLRVTGRSNAIVGIGLDGSAPAPTPGAANDVLRVEGGGGNLIERIRIAGGQGGGIRLDGSARNRVINNEVRDVHHSSVAVVNLGADENYIADNRLSGSRTQNNIFISADDGSRPSKARIRGNIVVRNDCEGAFDTAIESGQNADGTLIEGNNIIGSRNPSILLRDGRGVRVLRNVIRNLPAARQDSNYSGIAIIPLFQNSLLQYGARIENNQIRGAARLSGIYVGGSGVSVLKNDIDSGTSISRPGGSPLAGYGVTLAGEVSDILISGNRVRGFERGIDLNMDGTPQRRSNIRVEGNSIAETMLAINAFAVAFGRSEITNNEIDGVAQFALVLVRAKTEGQLRYARNRVRFAGAGSRASEFNTDRPVAQMGILLK